jgi:hypothetical protein
LGILEQAIPAASRLGEHGSFSKDIHETHHESLPDLMNFSVALPRPVDENAAAHLLRADGDEDLCFALWHPSRGSTRFSALVTDLLLPEPGDRAGMMPLRRMVEPRR